jgi:hypothetical protein
MKEIQKMVETIAGDSVEMGEPTCVLWKADHKNCVGCPSELGCGKMVKFELLALIPMMYHPRDFADFQKMQTRIDELANSVLAAKSVEELHAIPDR